MIVTGKVWYSRCPDVCPSRCVRMGMAPTLGKACCFDVVRMQAVRRWTFRFRTFVVNGPMPCHVADSAVCVGLQWRTGRAGSCRGGLLCKHGCNLINIRLCNWYGGLSCSQMRLRFSPCMQVISFGILHRALLRPKGLLPHGEVYQASMAWPALASIRRAGCVVCFTSCVDFVVCCWFYLEELCAVQCYARYGCQKMHAGRSKARALSRMIWHNRTALVLIERLPYCHSWFCMPLIVFPFWKLERETQVGKLLQGVVYLCFWSEVFLLFTWRLANVVVCDTICRKAVLFFALFPLIWTGGG